MGARSGLDPFGSPDVLIDQNIGNAYRNVRLVARYMQLVIKLANSFEDGSLIPNIGIDGKDGKDGKDGTIITDAMLLNSVATYIAAHPIRDGRDATDEQVAAGLLRYFLAHPVEDGEDGNDGRGITDIDITNNHLIFTMTDGKVIDAGELQKLEAITIFNTLSNSSRLGSEVEGFMEAFTALDYRVARIKAGLLVTQGTRVDLEERMTVLEEA